jgi:hypothetical protein
VLEREIESWAKVYARKRGYWCRKFTSPQHRSAPDDIFAKNGRVFFVEFKRTGVSPTELQLEEHNAMRAAGMTVYVCDSRKGEEKHAKHQTFVDIIELQEALNRVTSWDD